MTRSPRAIRLSDDDVWLLRRAALLRGVGWTTLVREVAVAYARRLVSRPRAHGYAPVCPHCGRAEGRTTSGGGGER